MSWRTHCVHRLTCDQPGCNATWDGGMDRNIQDVAREAEFVHGWRRLAKVDLCPLHGWARVQAEAAPHQTEETMSDPCINCGAPDTDLYSVDVDLPNIRLCSVCSVTITLDPALFDDMGSRRRKP